MRCQLYNGTFPAWAALETNLCDRTQRGVQSILTPRELIFLNGPPGSGKGANMPFIKRIRGLSQSVVVSGLLARRPETRNIVESGGLVSDESVCDVVLEALFDPLFTSQAGCIVDGFPRSTSQVCPSLLVLPLVVTRNSACWQGQISRHAPASIPTS